MLVPKACEMLLGVVCEWRALKGGRQGGRSGEDATFSCESLGCLSFELRGRHGACPEVKGTSASAGKRLSRRGQTRLDGRAKLLAEGAEMRRRRRR